LAATTRRYFAALWRKPPPAFSPQVADGGERLGRLRLPFARLSATGGEIDGFRRFCGGVLDPPQNAGGGQAALSLFPPGK